MLRKLMMSVMQTGVLLPLEIVATRHYYRRFHRLFTAAVVIILSYQQKLMIISYVTVHLELKLHARTI
jgi:hypothetical protein